MQFQSVSAPRGFARVVLVLSIALIGAAAGAAAQTIPNPGDVTSPAPRTPGHALISGPHEVVNPANGSLTLTFSLPLPPGRGLTPAFTISYSSAGAHVFGSYGNDLATMYAQSYLLSSDGWSYGAPVLTYSTSDQASPDGAETCTVSTDYTVQLPDGSRRPLLLSNTGRSGPGPGYDDPCDGFYQFSESTSVTLAGWLASTVPLQDALWGWRAVTLTSPDGTETFFPNGGMPESGIPATDTVDRNGNRVNYSISSSNALTITDTLGRVITASGFAQSQDTISIPGMSDAYTVAWASAPASQAISVTGADPGPCPNTTATMQGGTVVTSIATPEGTYNFTYDPVYGVVNEIQYPNGGEIHYTWALNPQSEPAQLQTWNGSQYQTCNARFDNPVITERDVYVNGTEVERQQFQYTTTWYTGTDENFWTNKQTIVTDTDELTGASRTLTYEYVNAPDPRQPHTGSIANESPVEQSVSTASGGTTLQTITENWSGYPFLPTMRQTQRGSALKESDYAYTSGTMQLAQEDDYDWGAGAHGALLRQINVNYTAFSGSNIVDRPASVITYSDAGQTRVAETDYTYDQTTPLATSGIVQHVAPPEGSRANLTTISRWLNTGSAAVTTLSYDDTGQILSETDPKGNTTAYSYTDNFSGGGEPGPTNAYVTTITPPTTPGCPSGGNCHVDHYVWFYAGGDMASHTDANGNTSSYVYNDPWDRLTEIEFPGGGATTYAYTTSTLETKRLEGSNYWTDQLDTFDGLDRLSVSAHTNGNGNWDRVETCYDGFGQKDYVTYPFASSSSGGAAPCSQPGDSYARDALGRVTKITHADGAYATTQYSGAATETTDAGDGSGAISKITQVDGLGRLEAVCEVTSVTGTVANSTPSDCNQQISGVTLDLDATGFLTVYTHNALGLLTRVQQPGLADRTFTWDSLSRLLTSSNPETGTTSFGYDADSNLITKTMADGVVTSYSYDALNRPTGRTFTVNGAPDPADTVALAYDTDPTGLTTYGAYNHLTRVTNGSPVVLSFNQYDPMGRAQVLDTIINGTTYHASTDYDDIGFSTYERYPSGRVVWLEDDAAGRTSWIQDQDSAKTTYVHDRYYTPWGAPYDSDLGNNDTQEWHFDSRTRLTATDVHPHGDYTWGDQVLYVSYTYNPDSTVATLSDGMGLSAEDLSFTYDPLGRLSAWSTGAGLSCTFGIDRYGNLVDTSGNSACGMLTGRSANANNQIAGDVYDASGFPLSDTAGTSYSWNVEGELSGFQQSGEPAYTYLYDGLGRRVEKLENGTVVAVYLRNAQGEMVSELDGSQFTDSIISPSDGTRIAAVDPSGAVYYYHDGAPGTTRAITDGSGKNILSCGQSSHYPGASMLTYAPFGAEVGGCTQSTLPYKFTGKYRDAESTLDDFGARYYQSELGRFLSPDWSAAPEAVPYANLSNPQSLNLYSYVLNNPTSTTDEYGHSYLIFDGATHTISLYTKDGKFVGSWPAFDHVDSHATIGRLVDGTYPFMDATAPHMHSGPEATPSGSIGPYGIFRLLGFKGADGNEHSGIGIHAGRVGVPDALHRTGAAHATRGCVRTCGGAMLAISILAKADPLTTLTVQDNRKPVTCKEQTPCAPSVPAAASGSQKPSGGGAPEVLLLSYHPPQAEAPWGNSENILSGVNVYRSTIPQVIAKLGNPERFQEVVNSDTPKGSGYRDYYWVRGGVTMRAETGFYTNATAHQVVESRVLNVTVKGRAPADGMGVTGSGLALGDTYADVVRIYGGRAKISRGDPGKYSVEFEDGTFLGITMDPKGHIVRMDLDANVD